MNRIHVLDQATIDKIAAGEVVERPASVIKELVENAIDAGAGRITAEIRDGGISMMRVTDNGHGIASEDIPLAFTRHATSKIEDDRDLLTLHSLGFRGEALSSISAVSRVELITKRPEDLTASRCLVEGGRERLLEEVGAPDGTTIIVRDLFFNTPARAKFLKTPMTEASHVGAVIEQMILSNPDIAFTFIVNGQTKLISDGSGRLTDAIFGIYGRSLSAQLVPLAYEDGAVCIRGMIGKPQITRGNRNYEQYYVNGRCVRSRLIARAIEDGYGTKLMQHQYPFVCLSLAVSEQAVDVNVHPSKLEVRFSDEKAVYNAVRAAVEQTLSGLEMIADGAAAETARPAQDRKDEVRPAEPFEQNAAGKALKRTLLAEQPVRYAGESLIHDELKKGQDLFEGFGRTENKAENWTENKTENWAENEAENETESSLSGTEAQSGAEEISGGQFVQQSFTPRFLSKEAKPNRRIVGQILSTYWIAEYGEKVFVFDQHAAHERVLFETFMKEYEERSISSQQLSPPMLVTLDVREEAVLLSSMDAFTEMGFEIEPFGERVYAVRAVPYSIGTIESDVLFRDLLDQLEISPDLKDMKRYVRKVATEACKAAVKGGGRVSAEEAGQLLDDLMNCEDPYHCPHGRPTIISFSKEEIEKRFKRIV